MESDHALPSSEGTAYPFWIIVTLSRRGVITFLDGVWFSRAAAEEYLSDHAYNYPKNALVYCASGHKSYGWRTLCKAGSVPDAR